MTVMKAKVIALFLILIALSGCYSGFKMTKEPPLKEDVASSPNRSDLYSVYVSGITLKNNNLAAGFEGRLLSRLNKTGLYKDAVYGVYARKPEGKYIDASLDIDEHVDAHTVGNAFKGFFVGATLFMLTPALPLTSDYEGNFKMTVRWPNGISKSYSAICASDAYGTYFQASEAMKKANGQAVDECLNSVVNQMSNDYAIMARQ